MRAAELRLATSRMETRLRPSQIYPAFRDLCNFGEGLKRSCDAFSDILLGELSL